LRVPCVGPLLAPSAIPSWEFSLALFHRQNHPDFCMGLAGRQGDLDSWSGAQGLNKEGAVDLVGLAIRQATI
jgi:hypothetical protein